MIPTLKMVCQTCNNEFGINPGHYAKMDFKSLPKRCPTCMDKEQLRPSVVIERKLLNVYDGVEVKSLPPGNWKIVERQHGDSASFKLSVKGRRYGASWNGRLDIFALSPPRVGDVVSVREMEAQHLVKRLIINKQTFEHGVVRTEKVLPITSDNANAEEVIKIHRYLVIETCDGEAVSRLVWAEAHTKTTLKGFGRQYWAKVAGAPIAKWEISGGARSGRFDSTGVLAIVSPDHPLYIIKNGDIQGEETYS